jgi:uncharacterized membrane protein
MVHTALPGLVVAAYNNVKVHAIPSSGAQWWLKTMMMDMAK